MAGTTAEIATLQTKLDTLGARSEVAGVRIDLASNTRIQQLQAQANAHIPCMYAKNLVATGIKDIVTAYRSVNPNLAYVVLVGGDQAIPFFRYPDQSLLGEERDYDAPVGPPTASKASLASNFVLGQDAYGATTELSLRASTFPVPDLAVGRLVETAAEASSVIDAYLGTAAGVVATPTTSLVTGYDFLEDAAKSVKSDLDLGIGSSGDSLITRSTVAPGKLCDPFATTPVALPDCSWNADDLKTKLLGSRHDLIYLAGHFSANNALAADYLTTVNAADLANAPTALDLRNSIIFSAGCHSGYNIVNGDATSEPFSLDWAQAAAQRGATLIAGTGYQYGDTDFLEYSERIYAEFAHQLRVGTGAVSIGQALMRAKQIYLASTPDIRGLHEKALLESAIFGLPMLSVNMPTGRVLAPTTTSIVPSSAGFAANPGLTLGLQTAEVALGPISADVKSVTLAQLDAATPPAAVGTVTATYFRGRDGVVTNPGEPALPLQSENVSVSGKVLRGVGFRSGTFADSTIVPLTGAAATEIRGIHNTFSSTAFYPMRPWTVNYYDALAGGATRLLVTPAQHKVTSVGDQTATLRLYSAMGLRLFYSDYRGNAAQAAAPTITGVRATVNGSVVAVQARVTGDPAAGIQQVWMTHNGTPNQWQSFDLIQDPLDSTRWKGTLSLPSGGTPSDQLLFMIQAVNGVGLVAMDDNLGDYYSIFDSTRPSISASISGGIVGSNGWFRSDVVVHFTCRDSTGVRIPNPACPADQVLSAEGPSVSSSAMTVTNAAGNTSAPSNVISVKIDKTPPTIGAAVIGGTVGSNDWYRSNVTIGHTCADTGGSGIPSGACPANQLLTSEAPAVSSTAQMVSDRAGNTSAPSNVVTVKIDKTAPTIAVAVSGGTVGTNGWYTSNVTVRATCDDGLGSGIPVTGCPAVQILTGEGSSVASSSVSATDAAGNTSAPSSVVTVKIDKTAPTLNPSVSPNPVVLNGSATATSGAADATSGIASQSCGAVNTSAVGTQTVSCIATDVAGISSTNLSVPYRVMWPFTGFFSPVDNLPILNIATAGSTIPVKFSLGGNRGLAIFYDTTYPKAVPVACPSSATTDTIEVTTTSASGLTYDASTNTYQYNWKTAKTFATKCYRLDIKFVDGSTYSANFQFK